MGLLGISGGLQHLGPPSCAVMGFCGNWLVKPEMGGTCPVPLHVPLSFYLFFYRIDPSFVFSIFSFFFLAIAAVETQGLSSCPLLLTDVPGNSVKGDRVHLPLGARGPRSCGHPRVPHPARGSGSHRALPAWIAFSICQACWCFSLVPAWHVGPPNPSLPVSDLPCFFKAQNFTFLMSTSFMLPLPEQGTETRVIRSRGRSSHRFNRNYQQVVTGCL